MGSESNEDDDDRLADDDDDGEDKSCVGIFKSTIGRVTACADVAVDDDIP